MCRIYRVAISYIIEKLIKKSVRIHSIVSVGVFEIGVAWNKQFEYILGYFNNLPSKPIHKTAMKDTRMFQSGEQKEDTSPKADQQAESIERKEEDK